MATVAAHNYGEGLGSASLTVINSTVSGNSAGLGGGIINAGDGGSASLTVINSTFRGNSAIGGGGSIYNTGFHGSATLKIGSTILNAGPLGGNIVNRSATVTSEGYNLSSDDGGGFLTRSEEHTSELQSLRH